MLTTAQIARQFGKTHGALNPIEASYKRLEAAIATMLMITATVKATDDLGDGWENSDDPKYEEKWASLAYRVGMNYFVYEWEPEPPADFQRFYRAFLESLQLLTASVGYRNRPDSYLSSGR